ncbi:autotransporter outer membrane beta-barrel domain-containing protein [Chelatococcus reniformis]|uniref:Autotransporter domain-containing protein n=1 Tax=Chelatococcus reniformis TaxID=1494448 RepID=A0A916XPK2_9HYPH|nr:autotransporter outer membrane beta-barrel domain-containing protein [Chelatococcus reniformis]GGC92686.1 hypothetical protein GCM10010994_58150 [Chelatococcus reniformis]
MWFAARGAWRRSLLFVSAAAMLAATPALADPVALPWGDPASVSVLQRAIDQFRVDKRIPGAVVLLRQGDSSFAINSGVADIATNAAPTPDTYFGYRSVTKSFVTTVVMQLAQEGRLKLDDPVGKYVAGVPSGDVITVRQLAEMRSGLFSYTASPAFGEAAGADPGKVWTPDELLAYGFAQPLQFTPGTSFQYSNTNTVLLGQVIAAVTGSAWSVEVQRRLSGPLGLASVIDQGGGALPQPNAVGYFDAGEGPVALDEFNASGAGASGALTGVARDLERWGKAVGTGATLSEAEFVARMKSFGSTKSDPNSPEYDSYGFGMGEIQGWIGHTGNGLGFEVLVMYDRATDRTITVLFNAANADDHDAPAHLFQELLGLLGWTPPANQRQVVADGGPAVVSAGTVWTGLVSGPFGARAAVYAANGGVVTADGPVTLAPMQDYVPAIFVGGNGRVALDQGGTISASVGGDGAFVQGGSGTAELSLTGVAVALRGDAVTGTGVDVRGGGSAVLNGVRISGAAQAALHAGGTAPASISATGLSVDLVGGHGAWATGNGTIALSGSTIVLRGAGHGLLATSLDAPARISALGSTVETFGAFSFGAVAQGAGASVALAGSRITTFGAFSHGAVLGQGAAMALAGSSIRAEGLAAAAVAAVPVVTTAGPSSAALSLDASSLSAASGIAVMAAGTDLVLNASRSVIAGAITAADTATIALTLDNGSAWTLAPADIAPPSRLSRIAVRDSSIAFAPPASAGAYQALAVGSYTGAGATLSMNAFLAGTGGADRLIIDGGTASGQTQLVIQPTGGGAPTTGDGILLVETVNGAQTSPTAFSLNGARVAAGAFDYNLYRGGLAGGDDWFLRSTRPAPGGSGLPDIRPEVAVDLALPAMAARFGLAMVGTYDDRADARAAAAGSPLGSSGAAWARAFGETGRNGSSGGSGFAQLDRFLGQGPSYDIRFAGFQAGLDLYRTDGTTGSRDLAGLFVGAGHIEGDVNAVYGGRAGQASMDAYAMGAYWTHRGAGGWYVDAAIQGTFYDQAHATSLLGEFLKTQGWGLLASLEGGYPIALGTAWTIEPQAQVIYQRLSFADGADRYGAVGYDTAGTAYGRIGARLTRAWMLDNGRAISTWGRVNLWHAFGDGPTATFASLSGAYPMAFDAGTGGTWAQLGAGVSAAVADNVSLFAAADCNVRLGSETGRSVGGRLGFRVTW